MDGVLIDARDWHYDALNRALKLFGLEINRYEHLVTYDGLPTRDKLEMLTKDKGLSRGLHNFINQVKQQFTTEIVFSRCKPVFQHQYALARLQQEDYRLAVCSNSIRKSVEMMLDKSKLLQYLEFYLSNEDVKRGKPDPEMYSTAIARLGIKPQECLIVEDSPYGVESAKASGAHVMQVEGCADVHYQNIMQHVESYEKRGAL